MTGKIKNTIFIFSSVVLSLSIGYLIGIKRRTREAVDGILRIDNSDPTMPNNLFLELNLPVESIVHNKTVRFKILNKNYIRR